MKNLLKVIKSSLSGNVCAVVLMKADLSAIVSTKAEASAKEDLTPNKESRYGHLKIGSWKLDIGHSVFKRAEVEAT